MSGRALLALLLALTGIAPVTARACGPYSVAFYEYSALYYRDADGRWAGLDKDLIDELARRTGCRFDTRVESRVRTWAQLATGQLDITVSALPTPERELIVELIPYVESRQFVLVRPEMARSLDSPAAFLADRSRRVLVVRGFVYTPTLDTWITQMRVQGQVVEAPDQPTAMRVFKAGRADALIIGANSLAAARRQDPVFVTLVAQSFAPNEHSVGALALSRQRVSLEDRNLLRQALQQMLKDGTLDALKRKHLGEPAVPALAASTVAR